MPNKRQRANRRLASTRAAVTAHPNDVDREPRVPLAGFEGLYEITRAGDVFSRRENRFIKQRFYEYRSYIEFQVGGQKHQLDIAEAVEASWGRAKPRLFRVDIPATTLVVLAHDEREAVRVAANGIAEEITDWRLPVAATGITSPEQVPESWAEGYPYGPEGVDTTDRTIAERLDGP